MDLKGFDPSKLAGLAKQAKEQLENIDAFQEIEKKLLSGDFLEIFQNFGKLLGKKPEDKEVQGQVGKLQDCVTKQLGSCGPELLSKLGNLFSGNKEVAEQIDKAGGEGTAGFISKAIEHFCK